MSPVPLPTRVFLACGVTDMRKGFDGLAVLVQQVLTNLTIHSQDHLVVMEKELISLDQDILLELLDHHLLVALVVVIALL